MRNGAVLRRGILGLTLFTIALSAAAASPPGALASTSIGPLELSGGGGAPIQVATLSSFHQVIAQNPTSKGYGGGGGVPREATVLTLTMPVDKSSPLLLQAATSGRHFEKASLIWAANGTDEAICMADVFVESYSTDLSGTPATDTVNLAFAKLQTKIGPGVNCSGSSTPPVETSLLGINARASTLSARVDCLTRRCEGIVTVSLPKSACPLSGAACSFTGGVRVGVNGDGKVTFNGDGSAFTGGVKLGIGGAGKFSMGDGSVRIVHLVVPSPLQKWLKGHSHATLGTIIVVRGLSKALLQHDLLGAPGTPGTDVPSVSASAPTPPPGPPPANAEPVTPQSLLLTGCSTPVVGAPPTVVSVTGTLTPPRSAAAVTLTYTPTSGPPPLPPPIIDSVATTAAGNFGENFDRRREGKDYSWSVVASAAEGGGYAAASSPPCAVPIP